MEVTAVVVMKAMVVMVRMRLEMIDGVLVLIVAMVTW